MYLVKRLRVLTAGLGVAAATAAAATTLFGDVRGRPVPPPTTARPDGGKTADELAVTKFTNLPALTYKARAGDSVFAWQVKPALEAAPARPRDVLVMVDTSASQAGVPLRQAREIVTALAAALSPDDRLSVWTVNTPAATRALTPDYQPPGSADVAAAAAALTEVEYGSGATDLKGGLAKALAAVQPNRGRQQVLLFLGDGDSGFDPLTEADRVAVGTQLDTADVYFFAVPLGLKVNPHNLHGLAALTGGAVVRLQEDLGHPAKRAAFVGRLKAALDGPVLKADRVTYGPGVTEVFPAKLPPLRADRPTLVMGRLAPGTAKLTAEVTGRSAHQPATVALAEDAPPSQVEHFFLHLMYEQWKDAPVKDAPAVLQADRALALASTQVKLYRDEFLTQATWAATVDRLDEAAKLFAAAASIDPTDGEAASGAALVERMRAGKVTKTDLKRKLGEKADAVKIDKDGVAAVRLVLEEFQPPPAPPGGAPPAPPGAEPPSPADFLRRAEELRRVEEGRTRELVAQTIREARRLLRTDPDLAYQNLKQQRNDVGTNPGLGDAARAQLQADLTAVMQEVFLKGNEIKRQAATERDQLANARRRLSEFERQLDDEKRVRARIDAFRELMQEARYELAYQEAQLMIAERVNRGQSVPVEATASYIIGQQATQLREWRELVRVREDRFLLAMMQTEKSHIPYPDEPPVHFPPAAVWRQLTGLRKERYENSNLGPDASPSQKRIQSIVENGVVVDYPTGGRSLKELPLTEVLSDLQKRYEVPFLINKSVFENPAALDDAKATNLSTDRLDGLTLGTFLDIYLRGLSVPEVTYIVRPDYIEITNYDRRMSEKVTRVFPAGDLTIPIPSAVNQQTLFQNLNIQQQTLAIFGAASLYGNSGFLGSGNLGGFGGGAGLGGQPGGGMGLMGMMGNPFMMGGGQGIVGLGGGPGGGVGQFGNLGGQFGLQGGDQYQLLEQLIYETVAKGEWANAPPPQDPNGVAGEAEPTLFAKREWLNSLGYYPPARALIVRGTSRYHPNSTVKLTAKDGLMGAAPRPNGDRLAGAGAAGGGVAAAPPAARPGPAARPTLVDPKFDPVALRKKLDTDPRRMWSQAVDWTVTDPGFIVACADALMQCDEYAAAAEVLKGSLRKGLTTEGWAHESLAVALQLGKASPAEVERAALSGVDLDPTDPAAFLKAAKAEAELNNHDLAVALCRRAAAVGPDLPAPYANALAYADKAGWVKPDTVQWATENLLRRDFGVVDGVDYAGRARELLPKFVERFDKAGVPAAGLRAAVTEQTRRDLVVELLWQGPADLDLTVAEPTGSVCSVTAKRTAAGGVLAADVLEQQDGEDKYRSETYTAASAFSGDYTVTVARAFGRPAGNTATLKVTKFKGTDREAHDLITVDLSKPGPVVVKLAGGTRAELAAVTADPVRPAAAPATAAGRRGMGGGVGPAGSAMSAPAAGTGSRLPPVVAAREQVLPGLGSAADLRAKYTLNADRQSYTLSVNPVFATAGGREVKLPKVDLLPGGEGR